MTDESYRALLLKGEEDAQGSLDQWLMKLSAGALAIALGFVRTKGAPSAGWALFSSWGLLGAAVCCIIFSFRTSREAFREAVKQADDHVDPDRIYRETPGGRHAAKTERLNDAALCAFVLGMICLGYFVATNIGRLT